MTMPEKDLRFSRKWKSGLKGFLEIKVYKYFKQHFVNNDQGKKYSLWVDRPTKYNTIFANIDSQCAQNKVLYK